MKKKNLGNFSKKMLVVLVIAILATSLVACSTPNANETVVSEDATNKTDSTTTESDTVVSEDASENDTVAHEHNYEADASSSVEATCETDGKEADKICSCGDVITGEVIPATGHQFGDYVSDGNATYESDGTKTATCSLCGKSDTVADEGSKLEYTFTNCEAVMYAKSSVNVRNLPSTDGDKLGGLSKGQEVTVTGQCNETGWYRIEFNNSIGYVSNSYLVNDKPVEETPTEPTEPSQPDEPGDCPYPLYQPVDNWTSISWYYVNDGRELEFWDTQRQILVERHGIASLGILTEWTGYFVDGAEVAKFTYYVK